MNNAFKPQRRKLITSLAALFAATSLPAWSSPQPVVVVTSFHDELVSRFEAAFEKAYPQYRLQVVWLMPNEAAPYLRKPKQSGVDVYWAASPRTFASLARDGTWRKLSVDRKGLPERAGNTPLTDTDGYYVATEMAGFGFVIAPEALAARQIAVPMDWPDLADPRLVGLVALPIPAKVGFAPPIVEIVLQAFGWERGWALWSQIAANATWVNQGATLVTEEVSSGRCAVGVSIDFFVTSAIANGAPLRFVYPRHTGVNQADAAITVGSSNPAGAQAFIDFLLSPQGQSILAHPDIRRLPVRPSTYDSLPVGYFNPFAAAATGGLQFNGDLARPRLALSSAVFQQMLVQPHDELKALWQRVRAAETSGKPVAAARKQLETPPITEAQAADEALRRQFASRFEGHQDEQLLATETTWQATCAQQRKAVHQLLDEAGA
ncbi:extracellular solute-binding protein [Rhodoferax sp. 4810]|nr:extracellular solute-binding protein [Rhodoferax jenense]